MSSIRRHPPNRGLNQGVRIDTILQSHRGLVIGASAALPLLACWLLSLIRDTVANTNAALVLVLLVVATAATGIRLAGIAGALAAAAGFDYFLTEPYYALNIAGPDDIATAVLLLLVSGLVGEIALWGRRQAARASREQGYLDGVIGTAATAAAGRSSTAQLIDHVADQITDVLQIDNARFDPGHPLRPSHPRRRRHRLPQQAHPGRRPPRPTHGRDHRIESHQRRHGLRPLPVHLGHQSGQAVPKPASGGRVARRAGRCRTSGPNPAIWRPDLNRRVHEH